MYVLKAKLMVQVQKKNPQKMKNKKILLKVFFKKNHVEAF